MMNKMNDRRQAMLRKVQICCFVLNEINLFLDSHPCSEEALAAFRKYKLMQDAAEKEYTDEFGPLTAAQTTGDSWTWVKGPWPWQM